MRSGGKIHNEVGIILHNFDHRTDSVASILSAIDDGNALAHSYFAIANTETSTEAIERIRIRKYWALDTTNEIECGNSTL